MAVRTYYIRCTVTAAINWGLNGGGTGDFLFAYSGYLADWFWYTDSPGGGWFSRVSGPPRMIELTAEQIYDFTDSAGGFLTPPAVTQASVQALLDNGASFYGTPQFYCQIQNIPWTLTGTNIPPEPAIVPVNLPADLATLMGGQWVFNTTVDNIEVDFAYVSFQLDVPASGSPPPGSGSGSGSAPAALQETAELAVLVAYDADVSAPPAVTPCTGGGTVAPGTNPAAGPDLSTATAPLAWLEITPNGGSTHRYAKAGIPHGAPRVGLVESFGRLARSLCDGDGGPQSTTIATTLIDTGLTLRALAAAGTLKHALAEYYVSDLATVKAGGQPTRRFRGRVAQWAAGADLRFTVTCEDELTARLTSIDARDVLVPQRVMDTSVTDNNPQQRMFEKPAPEGYGNVSDEDDPNVDSPIGVWECRHIANITVTGYEHLGNAPTFLVMAQVGSQVQALYAGDPTSGDPPVARVKMPASAYGDWTLNPDAYWLAPGTPGYPSASGVYYTGNGGRYYLVFGKDGHPSVKMAVEGRIPLAANFCGYETVGDGSGATIGSPARAFLHWLNNRLVQEATADWLPIEDLDDYSLFDTDTFEAVHDGQELLGAVSPFGYKIAGLVGADFTQVSWREGVAEFCRNFNFEFGINAHGQVILVRLDRADDAFGAPALGPSVILERGCDVDMRQDAVENRVLYAYRRNYLSALQDLSPAEGERGLREPFDAQWLSGRQTIQDGASIANLGGDPRGVRRSALQEYGLSRDQNTADDVAAERLALRRPPNGRAEVSLDLFLRDGCNLELGMLVTAEHWDLPWTGTRRCQVRQLQEDLDAFVTTVLLRDVDDLLA